ncbi:TniQ family protein [Kiloniella sp.]|uniref:TniQ family protein n=1 Tax=Kiloniella sp. TaxID=1938587 RepID=UPI003A8F85A2
MKLLETPAPHTDESLHGYLMRLSDLSMYDSLHWISELVDANTYSPAGLINLAQHAGALTSYVGQDINTLMEIGYTRGASKKAPMQAFGGQLIRRDIVDLKASKVCPECLKQSSHHRQLWDLAIFTHCPDHGCALFSNCPSCNTRLTWSRQTLGRCKCGFELQTACDVEEAHSVRELMKTIKVSAGIHVDYKLATPFRELSDLSVMDLNKVISLLGFLLGKVNSCDLSRLIGLSTIDRKELLLEASELLVDWPNNFWKQLDKFKEGREAQGFKTAGLRKMFGTVYVRLYDSENTTAFNLFRDAFKSYLTSRGLAGTIKNQGSTFVWGAIRDKKTLNRNEVEKLLKIGPKKIQWLEETGVLNPVTLESIEKKYRNYTAENVNQAKSYLDSLISLDDLCRIIGISRQVGDDLAAHGLLNAVRGPNVDGNRNWVFSSTAPQDFLNSLAKKTVTSKGISSQDLVSLNEAFSGLRQYGVSHLDAIMMVLGGELSVYLQRDPPKVLGDILVRRGDLSVQGILQMKSGIRSLVTT